MERPGPSVQQRGDKEELEGISWTKWSCKIKRNGLGQLEKTNWLFFFMFHVPHCHNMCHQETGSIAFGTHTQEELVWDHGGFPNWVCREDCIRANCLPGKKAPCSGAVGILFFLVFWHAKLKFLVNQILHANTCSLHTGSLKPKLFPNYSGCFLLSIGKEWRSSTRGPQQAPGTCSSTSKYVSVTLSGTGFLM